ncbi:MAG: hypothetical protein F9K29_23010 [Hyphomicrobiaceae bacterium]|nr:MAG: hypothetical protein F9K29_23010 [Hyphomicrobiaceae bacterium]
MPSLKTVAFVSLAAGVCALAAPRTALAQTAGCAWYADTAIKQQQENEQRRCGFKGAEWSANRQAHLAWCATQSPDSWKAQAQNRQRMLAGCRK